MSEEAALLRAVVARTGRDGWTRQTLRDALADRGEPPEMVSSAFPRGVPGAIEDWLASVNAAMEAAAAGEDFSALRTPERIRRLFAIRLRMLEPDRDAWRGAMRHLALPWNLPLALRCAARTASAIWYAAGDQSSDFSWYTRRATLMSVDAAVMVYWLGPAQPDIEQTLSFLDRRLADLPQPKRKVA
ncbi:COQ9 family protein [Roseococcus sp. YIM B11640]|uniref:COQ9 family protein n=1 Tax=Roseococcus sp. YIM B11640 TaxID=3133973 RepID=UPI003C7DD5E0